MITLGKGSVESSRFVCQFYFILCRWKFPTLVVGGESPFDSASNISDHGGCLSWFSSEIWDQFRKDFKYLELVSYVKYTSNRVMTFLSFSVIKLTSVKFPLNPFEKTSVSVIKGSCG